MDKTEDGAKVALKINRLLKTGTWEEIKNAVRPFPLPFPKRENKKAFYEEKYLREGFERKEAETMAGLVCPDLPVYEGITDCAFVLDTGIIFPGEKDLVFFTRETAGRLGKSPEDLFDAAVSNMESDPVLFGREKRGLYVMKPERRTVPANACALLYSKKAWGRVAKIFGCGAFAYVFTRDYVLLAPETYTGGAMGARDAFTASRLENKRRVLTSFPPVFLHMGSDGRAGIVIM